MSVRSPIREPSRELRRRAERAVSRVFWPRVLLLCVLLGAALILDRVLDLAGPAALEAGREFASAAPALGAEAARPDLVFESVEVDLGRLEPGQPTSVVVPWHRTGRGVLHVRTVDTGCACVRGEGLPESLEAGAAGALAVHVQGRTTLGPFVAFVRVVTDRSDDAVRRLRLRGFVGESTMLEPRGLHVGDVRAGARIERALSLRPPPDRPVPRVTARIEGLSGACEVGPPGDRSAFGVDVRIHATAPSEAGAFDAEVDVRMGDVGFWRGPLLGRVVAVPSAAVPSAAVPPAAVPPAAASPAVFPMRGGAAPK